MRAVQRVKVRVWYMDSFSSCLTLVQRRTLDEITLPLFLKDNFPRIKDEPWWNFKSILAPIYGYFSVF